MITNFPRLRAAIAANTIPRNGEALDQGHAAVAAELLPALFGGEWIMARAWPVRTPRFQIRWPLFDHPVPFRRRGFRGRANWNNTVLIGQPYLAPNRELNEDAYDLADLFAAGGIAAWHCREKSYYYPGRTTLAIAARGIDNACATALGFSQIGGAL
jgi:hypothetical protein